MYKRVILRGADEQNIDDKKENEISRIQEKDEIIFQIQQIKAKYLLWCHIAKYICLPYVFQHDFSIFEMTF